MTSAPPREALAEAAEEPAVPEPVNPGSDPAPAGSQPPDPAHRNPYRDLLARLATALATGIGIGIGQRLADMLLPRRARRPRRPPTR